MKNLIPVFFILIGISTSCVTFSEKEADKELKMQADSLLKELMNAHDEVMPQTMTLENVKKKILMRLDSAEIDSVSLEQMKITINTMDTAILGMRSWMSGFERPADSVTLKNVVDYYRSEIEKMQKVKEVTTEILPIAQDKLSELDSL